ncbi:hypothetical protein [Litorimonas haliclonae]|uniref:hypothetical protein n=1 Tax=Litorimonas haliclonae TaxID=2081977 RepID=UPI0039EDEEBD
MTAYVTRKACTVHLASGALHFVRDNVGYSVDGVNYTAAPYGNLHGYASQPGTVSDKCRITLDGSHILSGPDGQGTPDSVLQSIFEERLRKVRVDFHRLDLDIDTMLAVSRKHKFAGRIDKAYLDRSDERKPMFIIECLSFRLLAQNPAQRIYSDVDQRLLHPRDGCFKHLSDVVFRNGVFDWNKEGSGSGGYTVPSNPGGSPYRPNQGPRTVYR